MTQPLMYLFCLGIEGQLDLSLLDSSALKESISSL
jgi:hypothetical protein